MNVPKAKLPTMRLLPITVAAVAALTGVKAIDIWQGGRLLGAPSAVAEVSKATGAPTALIPAEQKPAQPQQVATAEPAATPKPVAAPAPQRRDATSYSAAEIDVLQSLAKRREALEQREKDLDAREALMAATEKRIDSRIGELKAMEQKLTKLAKSRTEEDERRLGSLVKVYEAMKPADAARIFQELDMPVLLDVVERMKEAKIAPVLAQMAPPKAKALTMELAQRRDAGTEAAPKAAAAAPAAPATAPVPAKPSTVADPAPKAGADAAAKGKSG